MAGTVHRDVAKRFVIGVVAAVVAVVAVLIGVRPLLGGELTGVPYTYITVEFDDVGTLKSKLDVRENSIVTGKVADVRYENGRAVVTARLDGEKPVYRNATAKVLDESALAQKFVEIDRGSPEAGLLGDAPIPASRTQDASNLDEVFNVFDERTRPALQGTVTELATGLGGHAGDVNQALRSLPGMLGDLETVTGSLSSRRAALAPLLNSANRLTGRFGGHDDELRSLIHEADSTLEALNVDEAKPLDATLTKLPATLREARAGLAALDRPLGDVESAVRTIRPGGEALGRATPDVRGVLREAVPPLDKVPGVADSANPAVDELTDTMVDLRPLAPRLTQTLGHTTGLLKGLSPYASDVGQFFAQEDLLRGRLGGNDDFHFFSAMLPPPGLHDVSLPDPLARQDFYPKPGTAAPHRFQNGGPR